jgi:hypothetical protein
MTGLAPEARVPRSSEPGTLDFALVVAGVFGRFAEYVMVDVAWAGRIVFDTRTGPSLVAWPVTGSRLVPFRKEPPPLTR